MESNDPDCNDEFTARDIFGAALEISDPDRRAQFVEIACGEDQDLRLKVETLIKSFLQAGDFMETPSRTGRGRRP